MADVDNGNYHYNLYVIMIGIICQQSHTWRLIWVYFLQIVNGLGAIGGISKISEKGEMKDVLR